MKKMPFDSTLKHLEQAGGPLPDDFEPTPVKANKVILKWKDSIMEWEIVNEDGE